VRLRDNRETGQRLDGQPVGPAHGADGRELQAGGVVDPVGIAPVVAIDATAINAWANGNRTEPADRDASWGCKGHKEKGESGWWFGYKEHLAVDTRAELVLAYKTTTASKSEAKNLKPLLEKLDDLLPAGIWRR
jgi:IS5 family transposase